MTEEIIEYLKQLVQCDKSLSSEVWFSSGNSKESELAGERMNLAIDVLEYLESPPPGSKASIARNNNLTKNQNPHKSKKIL